MKIIRLFLLLGTMLFGGIEMYGQVMKAADLEKYAKQKYGDKWLEAAKHYPFVEKDAQKRTCSKALVMTHAYSNAILDKVEEAIKNGVAGSDDVDW